MNWHLKIRQRREALGWTQAELARRVGITQAAVTKIEGGRVTRSRFIGKLARVLGLDVTELDEDLRVQFPDKPLLPAAVISRKLVGGDYALGMNEISSAVLHAREDGFMLAIETPDMKISAPPMVMEHETRFAFVMEYNELMEPEINPNDVIFAVHSPVVDGTTCILFSNPSSLFGSRLGTIRRVIRQNADSYLVRVWRPSKGIEREEVLPKSEWPICLPIVAKYAGYVASDPLKLEGA